MIARPLARALAVLVCAACLAAAPRRAAAQVAGGGTTLELAEAALQNQDYARAGNLAEPVARQGPGVARSDRAEAWRILGLARYFVGNLAEAEAAFLEYLKLDVDARLDPALVAPEAVTFFEDVRARHASELKRYKPRPRSRMMLALLPPAGQFDNGHKVRGWVIAGAGVALLATNLATYMMLRDWCDPDRTCDGEDGEQASKARTARSINHWTGGALIGLYAVGVVDAAISYWRAGRRSEEPPAATSWSVMPSGDGAVVSLQHAF